MSKKISELTEGTVVDEANDIVPIVQGGATKKMKVKNLTSIDGKPAKTTPVDADEMALADSAASFATKKLTWANLKATAKTYFDTVYNKLITSPTNGNIVTTNGSGQALDSGKTFDTDTSLSANSDNKIATQKAVKTYIDALLGAQDAMVYKGALDCSANPNYPAGNAGDTYRVSVAGKIGGASGVNVEVGDYVICNTDATSSGNQATVGTKWNVIQTNLDGAVIGPASATDGAFALYDGATGKLIKDSTKSPSTDGTFASNTDSKIPTEKAVKTYADGLVNIDALTGKTTPVDADEMALADSAASFARKKLTWANLKATLKTYFDGTYQTLSTALLLTGGSMSGAINEAQGANIASAATTNIGAATGNYVQITGTTTITAFDAVQAGTRRVLEFAAALTLTHNATSLILPGGANITTAAGDVAIFMSEGSGNWRCIGFMKANGKSVIASADSDVTFTDITTNNSSSSKHGYLPKLSGNSYDSLDGSGAWQRRSNGGLFCAMGNGNTLTTGATQYAQPGFGASLNNTETNRAVSMPYAGLCKNMYTRISGTQTGGTLVITARKELASQSVVITIASGAGSGQYSDTSNSFTFAVGDRLSFQITNNGSGTSSTILEINIGTYDN